MPRQQDTLFGSSTNRGSDSKNNDNNNNSKKSSSKSRRRLHEVEVISTTPCTAPLRKPKQDGSGSYTLQQSSSTHRRSSLQLLNDDQLLKQQQLPSNSVNSNSVEGTVDEYNRISNRTGGFEGALPLQYDAIIFPDDDNNIHETQTVQPNQSQQAIGFESTSIQSSPEFGHRLRRSQQTKGMATTEIKSRRRLFPLQRKLTFVDNRNDNNNISNKQTSPSKQQPNFFKRWTGIGSSGNNNSNNITSSTEQNNISSSSFQTGVVPPKLRLPSLQEDHRSHRSSTPSNQSQLEKTAAPTTPTRGKYPIGSPRFVLPDETPPGAQSLRNKNRKSKDTDNTSAAIDANQSRSQSGGGHSSLENDQGFELSIASAPPTFNSTPRKQQLHREQSKRSVPVDLDEVDDESTSGDEDMNRNKKHSDKEDTKTKKSHSNNKKLTGTRSFSVSPTRRRIRKESVSPGRRSTNSRASSRSAHARLGVRLDSDDDVTNFSAQHLGGRSELSQQHSSSSQQGDWRNGLRKWVMPTKRKDDKKPIIESMRSGSAIEVQQKRDTKFEKKGSIIAKDSDRQNACMSDELKSVSPDQRESIFANIELVDREIGHDNMRNRSAEKSTNYTQSTIASSKDAATTASPAVKLPRCVVCNFYDRTHICIPCMHFAYCRECSIRLTKLGKGCALCQKQNVTFAEVSV